MKLWSSERRVFTIAFGKGVSLIEVAQPIPKYNMMYSNNKIIIGGNRTGEVIKFIADI